MLKKLLLIAKCGYDENCVYSFMIRLSFLNHSFMVISLAIGYLYTIFSLDVD